MNLELSKRLIVVLSLVAMVFAIPAFAEWGGLSVIPTAATANSIFDTSCVWTDPDNTGPSDPEMVGNIWVEIYLDGKATGCRVWEAKTEAKEKGGGFKRTFQVSVSRGLNLRDQRPPASAFNMWLPDTGMPDPAGIATRAAMQGNDKYLYDPYFNNMLGFPTGLPMNYLRALAATNLLGTKYSMTYVAHVTYVDPIPDPADPTAAPAKRKDSEDIASSAMEVTVYDSTPTPMMARAEWLDHGGYASNLDRLVSYSGSDYPAVVPLDPLTPVSPSVLVPKSVNTPDSGASSDAYQFRVIYKNFANLPPKQWLPNWADEFDAGRMYGRAQEMTNTPLQGTGVVLYLDLFDCFDLGPDHRHDGYRPHFMRQEDPTKTDYQTGVVFYYNLEPHASPWMMGQSHVMTLDDNLYAPVGQIVPHNDDYVSLITGTYHYFFGCSDDQLYWIDTLTNDKIFLGENQPNWDAYGQTFFDVRSGSRSSTMLDPSNPRNVINKETGLTMDALTREQGRRPSLYEDPTTGFEPYDSTLYVDRSGEMPGCYQLWQYIKYPWAASQYPVVTSELRGWPQDIRNGYGRFLGTISPYNRGVNPVLPYDSRQRALYGYEANREETCYVSSATTVTFKTKYFQQDNKAPVWVKVFIGDGSIKCIDGVHLEKGVLMYDGSSPLTLENGGFTAYTMQPSSVQTSIGQEQTAPYIYAYGVDYQYRCQLPPGPHMYFFMAYDGENYSLFPNRPEPWTYNGPTYDDWWVPGTNPGDPGTKTGDTQLYDNNYFPGPYVNTKCELYNSSVTPTTGAQGQNFEFRVTYKDVDTQRPYSAFVYIDTGNPEIGDNGVVKAIMQREDPSSFDYSKGVTYICRTATLENFSIAKGVRHYRFEFTDDWGRQYDANDYVKGETTTLPINGGWIDGPTIGDNFPPTLRNGNVVSLDGTSNTASVWTFSVNYKDQNNDAPKYISVYIGKLTEDGQTIQWDAGHPMSKIDPTDKVYTDGCGYSYQTKLPGAVNPGDYAPTYYYAFEANDGANWATWVPTTHPDQKAWSESAGCLIKDNLIPSQDNPTFVFTVSKQPLVGTLKKDTVFSTVFIDPIVYKYVGGDITMAPTTMTRTDDYVIMAEALDTHTGYIVLDNFEPAYQPDMSSIIGVYNNPDLTGTNYYQDDTGAHGMFQVSNGSVFITTVQQLPAGTGQVWVKYHHDGDYTLDRISGELTFAAAQDPADMLKADYFFATKIDSPIVSNQVPVLLEPKLTPLAGSSGTDFVYTVVYKETEGLNGQAPSYVRVVIDGQPREMTPVVGGMPSYRSGVTYKCIAKLASGSHNYYFVTSDGQGQVSLPPTDVSTGNIEPINGPWVNDPPALSAGMADPNPTGQTISTQQSITYSVIYRDADGDAPITYSPFTSDIAASDAIKNMALSTPLLYVDNTDEVWNVGSVAELIADPLQPDKYRIIRVNGKDGNIAAYTADQFAGKLIQFTSGSLAGRIYLIANNTVDTLKIVVDDLVAEGLDTDSTFSIGIIQMSKSDASKIDFNNGVPYAVTVPQLMEGNHRFHFKAASIMNPPAWATGASNQSAWVRFPASGEILGPNVAVESPNLNHAPTLSMLSGDVPVSPASGKMTDTYDFYAAYQDDDGDAPGLHNNNVFGYIRIIFNDGSYAADMSPVATESGIDFYKTAQKFTARANGLPGGSHKFHFEASDGWLKTRWPALVQGSDPTSNDPVVAVNSTGVLKNVIITPPYGTTSSVFDLSVIYSDADGIAPQRVWVEIGGVEYTMTASGTSPNYTNGVLYTYRKSALPAGTHTVVFKSRDNAGELTSLNGTSIVISQNLNKPVLASGQVFNVSSPTDINENAAGGTSSTFRYKVTYSDSDGNAPLIDQNGIITEGIRLYVDGKLEATLGQAQRVGENFVSGVVYQYDRAGVKYTAGAHTFQFRATDDTNDATHAVQTDVASGPAIVNATIALSCESYDSSTQSWVARDPKISETMRISGTLTGSPGKPISSGQNFTVTITKPDGTKETLTAKGDGNNKFTFERVPTINKTWTIAARWEGTTDYKPAITQELKVEVKGPSRVVATVDMSLPATSAPVVDMVCLPLIAPNKDAGVLFGLDRANLMKIARWDPVQKTYLRYGETFFPTIEAGHAMWIYPNAQYPSELCDPVNPPYSADSEIIVNLSNRYRLLKPYGNLWESTKDCDITIHAGWNQIGMPFLTSTELSGVKVTYQGKTVSLDQAATSGWIRNYLWMWDAGSQSYKLIHATRPDAFSKAIDPWRGYWVRSFVECVLTIPVPGTQSAAAAARAMEAEAGSMSSSALPALDTPPAAPGTAGK